MATFSLALPPLRVEPMTLVGNDAPTITTFAINKPLATRVETLAVIVEVERARTIPMVGSMFKFPIRFDATSYVVRVEDYTSGVLTNEFDATLSGLDTDADYWMGGGNVSFDLLELWTDLGIGDLSLANGRITWVPTGVGGGVLRRINWGHVNTTLDPALFGFTSTSMTVAAASYTSPNCANGITRLEFPPTDDSYHSTPVVASSVATALGEVEAAFFGQQASERSLMWELLHDYAVVAELKSLPVTFYTVQELLAGPLANGDFVRFYLDETSETYEQYVHAVPFEQAYRRSSRHKLKWTWSVTLVVA